MGRQRVDDSRGSFHPSSPPVIIFFSCLLTYGLFCGLKNQQGKYHPSAPMVKIATPLNPGTTTRLKGFLLATLAQHMHVFRRRTSVLLFFGSCSLKCYNDGLIAAHQVDGNLY